MGRPTDRDERKSEVVNIRVTPTLKRKLEAHARIAGRRLSAECEERLAQSMMETESNATPETRELLSEIQRLIGDIEAQTETKWHIGLGTWKAVQEMLATGPIMERAPSSIGENDDRLKRLLTELHEGYGRQEEIMKGLELVGLVSKTNALMNAVALRDRIRAMQAEQSVKDSLCAVADELDQIEERRAEIWGKIDDLIEPFREAMEEGRRRYPKPVRGITLGAIMARLDPKPNALMLPTLSPLPALPFPPAQRTGLFGSFSAGTPPTEAPTLGGAWLGPLPERNDDSGSTGEDSV